MGDVGEGVVGEIRVVEDVLDLLGVSVLHNHGARGNAAQDLEDIIDGVELEKVVLVHLDILSR